MIEIQTPLIKAGYDNGLMLNLNPNGGVNGVTKDKQVIYDNLSKFRDKLKLDYPILVMLACLPCEDLDLLNQSDVAIDHVKKGIDFVLGLPVGQNKGITFHLGSLVSEEEFMGKNQKQWRNIFFENIIPTLKKYLNMLMIVVLKLEWRLYLFRILGISPHPMSGNIGGLN